MLYNHICLCYKKEIVQIYIHGMIQWQSVRAPLRYLNHVWGGGGRARDFLGFEVLVKKDFLVSTKGPRICLGHE